MLAVDEEEDENAGGAGDRVREEEDEGADGVVSEERE